VGAEHSRNRKIATGIDENEKTDMLRTYDEEERRKPEERNYTEEHAGRQSKGQNKMSWMDNIRTWTGLAVIGGEQTRMEECCAERVQPSEERGRIRTEHIVKWRSIND